MENCLADEVLSCLNQMQKDCAPLDAFTISCSLTAGATTGDIERGQELHVLAVVENFETESLVSNGLVDMYSKCGLLLESKEVFNELHVKDAVFLITLATGYAELGYMEEASERMKMIRAE
ncbi:hypothetical protein KP509_25G072400 [Ceratopteris richardii]|uniref:Pentatricopeptide repeat-containing protein n=1 Tax=Ceratopteris richardii TaxID=49495 RepID=A0A8T2RRJ3_CERRI|nr:hypothetical protein KP509_25G072400 [Ceratopteris richardii]